MMLEYDAYVTIGLVVILSVAVIGIVLWRSRKNRNN